MKRAVEVVEVNGISVSVTRRDGAPLIILTRMASKEMGVWDTVWDAFADHFTVANFDLNGLPGAARTDCYGEGFRALANNCAEVASGLGYERFHIFGWNGGTQIAMRCAVDHRDRVASCFLLDPFFELADMRRVWKAVEHKKALFTHPDRSLYPFYWVMAGFSDRFLDANFDTVERLVADRMRGDRFIQSDPERFIAWVRALRTNWITDREFATVTAPTYIMATELDRWSAGPSVAMAREIHVRIHGSRLVVIEDVGGHFLIEDPDRFIAVIRPFIAQVIGLAR